LSVAAVQLVVILSGVREETVKLDGADGGVVSGGPTDVFMSV